MQLQNNLNLKVSQRQVLTPGLVQMVSVLALNKLELKEMINTEMIENPMLEELEETAPPLDEIAADEAGKERTAEELATEAERVEKDPFDEIDFGSYFQDYLDPGYRTTSNYEELDSPSFENFLSQPGTLTDHLMWQLGSLKLEQAVHDAAELIIGNLNEDGYLAATLEELVQSLLDAPTAYPLESHADFGVEPLDSGQDDAVVTGEEAGAGMALAAAGMAPPVAHAEARAVVHAEARAHARAKAAVVAALAVVQQLDPVGVGARDLRECLLAQLGAQRREAELVLARHNHWAESHPDGGDGGDQEAAGMHMEAAGVHMEAAAHVAAHLAGHGVGHASGIGAGNVSGNISGNGAGNGAGAASANGSAPAGIFDVAERIVLSHLLLLQRKDMREVARAAACPVEIAQHAVDFIRTLDPRPGQRYNQGETRLIEPDVAFVKRGDEYLVVMNEEDMPTLRLSQNYRKLMRKENAEKEVRDYVKERYKSAIQLMRNIEQRKNTIRRTCEAIVRRQGDFLEQGVEGMKPMMIKEVAEEIGVHPSTVSRAVANKYVHTAQGVYELRFFFSEGVNGPEGGGTPLMLLKRKVKKMIEDEDPGKPLTDDHLAEMLQQQGIQVTRRTVAKYREDMRIPSTHQRRVRS